MEKSRVKVCHSSLKSRKWIFCNIFMFFNVLDFWKLLVIFGLLEVKTKTTHDLRNPFKVTQLYLEKYSH